MGLAFQYQLDHQHKKADPKCEGCWGSGWLLALVDDRLLLEEVGSNNRPADFVMACTECDCMTDRQAINQALKAGLILGKHGVVKEIPVSLKRTLVRPKVLPNKPKYRKLLEAYTQLIQDVGNVRRDMQSGGELRCRLSMAIENAMKTSEVYVPGVLPPRHGSYPH